MVLETVEMVLDTVEMVLRCEEGEEEVGAAVSVKATVSHRIVSWN